MFVHISPEFQVLSETLSTLKFAKRVSTVELGAAKVNKDSADTKELKGQIASLKAALAKKDGEAKQSDLSRWTSQMPSPTPSFSPSGGRSLEEHEQERTWNSPPWPNAASENGNDHNFPDNNNNNNNNNTSSAIIQRNQSFRFDDSLDHAAAEIKHVSSPISLSPKYLPKLSVVTATNNSDEMDLAIPRSECRDPETNSLSPKVATPTTPTGSVSKAKKSTHRKQAKNTETRSLTTLSGTRKQSSVSRQPRKHQGSADAKKKTGNAK